MLKFIIVIILLFLSLVISIYGFDNSFVQISNLHQSKKMIVMDNYFYQCQNGQNDSCSIEITDKESLSYVYNDYKCDDVIPLDSQLKRIIKINYHENYAVTSLYDNGKLLIKNNINTKSNYEIFDKKIYFFSRVGKDDFVVKCLNTNDLKVDEMTFKSVIDVIDISGDYLLFVGKDCGTITLYKKNQVVWCDKKLQNYQGYFKLGENGSVIYYEKNECKLINLKGEEKLLYSYPEGDTFISMSNNGKYAVYGNKSEYTLYDIENEKVLYSEKKPNNSKNRYIIVNNDEKILFFRLSTIINRTKITEKRNEYNADVILIDRDKNKKYIGLYEDIMDDNSNSILYVDDNYIYISTHNYGLKKIDYSK
jgi:hypothetical protein